MEVAGLMEASVRVRQVLSAVQKSFQADDAADAEEPQLPPFLSDATLIDIAGEPHLRPAATHDSQRTATNVPTCTPSK